MLDPGFGNASGTALPQPDLAEPTLASAARVNSAETRIFRFVFPKLGVGRDCPLEEQPCYINLLNDDTTDCQGKHELRS